MKNAKEIKRLEAVRTEIVRKQQWEYTHRGNTQECQRLWKEICNIDDQIEALKKAQ